MNIDASLVRRLVADQFPQWADLPLEPVVSAGTDNAIYRLGADLSVRLPRVERAAGQVAKEVRWLPVLAPLLPLAVPVPRGKGVPAHGYPWSWSVHPWLDGDNATIERLADPCEAARTLARFVVALQGIDAADGPRCGAPNEHRGVPLIRRDRLVRDAIGSLGDMIDARAASEAWEAALQVPAWDGPPVWLHGDIHAGNLLARQGRISAVVDFGLLGVGDPACDLMVAWNLLGVEAREVFRAATGVDDAIWARGRGWTLSVALIALACYLHTNPALAAMSRRAIDAVLADGG